MSKHDHNRTVSIEDAVQAVVAAMLFGEDAGIAATDEFAQDADSVTLDLGACNLVTVSADAATIIQRAYDQLAIRGAGVASPRTSLTRYDLRKNN